MHAGTRVVVVGTGQAGFQVAASLRQADFEGEITLVGDEPAPPYQRPPLSKAYLAGKVDVDKVHLRPATFYESKSIALVQGDRAVQIDRPARRVELASGRALPYDHLVLATGSRPRTLSVPGADLGGVFVLRTLADAGDLRERLDAGPRVVVIGGGFIGLELAAVARGKGADVTVVEALDRTMARVVSPAMSDHFAGLHEEAGARILHGTTVAALHGDDAGHVAEVELGDGRRLETDLAVVAIGIVPNVELAEAAGLVVQDGIVVDEHLRTEDPAIWAAGDCVAFPSIHAGRRVRLESVQNATDHGRAVAASIAGAPEPYTATPWFWTEQHGRRLQIVGLTQGHDTMVVRGDPADGSFSVFCYSDGRLLGVESVNRPADHMAARKLMDASATLEPDQAADEAFDLKAHAAGA
jgi:3-phenylpropionate/trans-cinnamate dioxygenase ferredoxin reductase component